MTLKERHECARFEKCRMRAARRDDRGKKTRRTEPSPAKLGASTSATRRFVAPPRAGSTVGPPGEDPAPLVFRAGVRSRPASLCGLRASMAASPALVPVWCLVTGMGSIPR